ncbi:hypothetical protein OG216_37875 [Streptomycetaceae bacterium NBC_01309]
MQKQRRALLAVAGLAAGVLLASCSNADGGVCYNDDYPVKMVGSASGTSCIDGDLEPPSGWVRYPAGQVPEELGDHWFRHWEYVVFDENSVPVATQLPAP